MYFIREFSAWCSTNISTFFVLVLNNKKMRKKRTLYLYTKSLKDQHRIIMTILFETVTGKFCAIKAMSLLPTMLTLHNHSVGSTQIGSPCEPL